MSKDIRHKKYCNCQISSDKEILKNKVEFSFCEKCGCVILKDSEGKIYYTLKAKKKQLPLELNPVSIVKHMKMKTEEKYPYIYEEFNVDKQDKNTKEKIVKSINIYLTHRKMLLFKLQKLIKTFDYCDMIFYQCLFYLDTYLSHKITEDYSEKRLLYYLIGFFLCSVKFRESDIYEPSFDSFFDLSKGLYLSTERIAEYEITCLQTIRYNVFSYSAYDWVTQLISNGIIFNCEINNTNEIILIKGHRHSLINTINKYAVKLLLALTSKSLFFKYSPMHLAFSLIHIAREKYIEPNMINQNLYFKLINLYDVKFKDYKKCYEELKADIEKNNIDNDKTKTEKEQDNFNKDYNNNDEEFDNFKEKGKYNSSKKLHEKSKNVHVSSKTKSSKTVMFVGKNSSKEENYNEERNEEIELPKEDNTIELTLNEVGTKKKYKIKSQKYNISTIKTEGRVSIDCNTNFFKSSENLQHIDFNKARYSINDFNDDKLGLHHSNINSLGKNRSKPLIKELQHLKKNTKGRYNSIATQKGEGYSNNSLLTEIDREKEKDINKTKKKSKFFFSNKNVDNFNFDNDLARKTLSNIKKVISSNKINNDNLDINNLRKNGKQYKLKANKNLEIRVSAFDEEIKNSK